MHASDRDLDEGNSRPWGELGKGFRVPTKGYYVSCMGKMQIKAGMWLTLLASSVSGSALDPSLDVSQYAHTSWKIRDGFTRGTISSIAQTPDGYLWLGTEFGLVRFDGVQAVPWQPGDDGQFPTTWVHELLVARDGTLWIGTHNGLASWKDGELRKYPEAAGHVTSLLQDAGGTIWVGIDAPGRLCAVREAKTQCSGAGNFGRTLRALYEDPKGNLWVSAQTGLWRWKPGPPKRYTLPGKPALAHSLVEDDGALLMATSNPLDGLVSGSIEGLKRLVDGKIRNRPLPAISWQFRPTRMLRTSDGSLWIGTVQGLMHLHQGRTDRFDGLSGDVILRIFEDREGNVWVATQDGLDRFREFAAPTISVNQGLSDASVSVLEATPDGSVWIVTANGLNRWQNNRMTVYSKRSVLDQSGREIERERMVSRSAAVIDNSGLRGTVSSLGQDNRGRLWAGGSDGVFYLDSGRFVRVLHISGGNLFSIVGDGTGKIWISHGDKGLLQTTPGGIVQRIPWTRFGHEDAAVALLPDPLQGGLWLGFFDGGIAYLKDGQVRASYSAAGGLGHGSVSDLRLGADGAVWAATEGGLSRAKDGSVMTLTSRNGLPCDAVLSAIEDNDHSFWLQMSCGLVRIARSELDAWERDSKHIVQTAIFGSSDGVRSRALAGNRSRLMTKSPDGKIWFSTPDGVTVIDPRDLPLNKLPPPVYVQQITEDGRKYPASQGVHLPARVRDLSIDYTALSLVEPEKVHFRFKLEGQDQDWREVVNQRSVEYSNLPPRNYRFRVMACNNSGVWNKAGADLDFSIAPAYYQTNWFRALCIAALLAMLWTVYQLRAGAAARREALLERHQTEVRALNDQLIKAQEAERMRISGELHDGVLQQITSLTLRLGTVKYQVPPDSEAKATINCLQQDLINIGTDIRQLSHELHPALLHDSGLAAALSSYCEEFSKIRGLSVSCQADESVKDLSPGTALCLYRIAQEALGNAAKHAKAEHVDVRLGRSNGHVLLSVSDDGVGCTPSEVGRSGGLGLINMRERVLQLEGTFEFESEPGRGAMVRATIPSRSAS
jgi:signal transduction histidine kinase/ligand-binding sensor domain-containing protein